MNPYVQETDVDEFLKARIESLPPSLSSAAQNDAVYATVAGILAPYELSPDIVESIKYEVFLILIQILPREELPDVLMTEYNISSTEAVSVSSELNEKVFQDYVSLLTNLPEIEPPKPEEYIPDADSTLKEGIALRPEDAHMAGTEAPQVKEGAPKPLTREELLSALATKRTMASDIEAVKRAQSAPAQETKLPPQSAS
jgi:hypothetical protein